MKFMAEKHSGFSLIELMIVVVIIGILGSIAVPSYNAYIENGKRAEGKAFALDIASRQERHFTQYSRYASSLIATDASGLNMGSASSENGTYSAVSSTSAANGNTTYLITLTPTTTDSTCGALTLTNTGARSAGGSVSDCWR